MISIISFLGDLFKTWVHTLFIVPFENWDMLWLLVPIWLAWFFAEFFQEKIGTSMGNAITNAVVILWGSIDCSRQTVNFIVKKTITSSFEIITRFTLVIFLFIYGFLIIHYGIKGNPIIKKIGRVRNITYVFAMFVPIFYNAIPFSLNHIIATFLFFPLFYYVIEAIDKLAPNPKAIEQDLKEASASSENKNISKPQNIMPTSFHTQVSQNPSSHSTTSNNSIQPGSHYYTNHLVQHQNSQKHDGYHPPQYYHIKK